MAINLAQIKKIAVFDDDPDMLDTVCEEVQDLGKEPIIISPPDEIRDLVRAIKGKADCTIFDHRLHKKGYAPFKGANAVATLFDAKLPSVLVTEWSATDIDLEIRPLRSRIPVMIERNNFDCSTLLKGLLDVINELNGAIKATRKLHKTLIRIESIIEYGQQKLVDVIIPGWSPREGIRFSLNEIPSHFHQYVVEGKRFYASVNTAAENAAELFLKDFQPILEI